MLFITNNSFSYQSFVYTPLKDQTVLFQTTQFSKSHLFALISNVKQFYLTHRLDLRPEWSWEQWQWRGTLCYPKFQHYSSLTIWLSSVISRTLVGRVLPLCRDAVSVFYIPSQLGWNRMRMTYKYLTKVKVRSPDGDTEYFDIVAGVLQTGDISTLDGTSLKLVDKFTYLGSSVSSTEKDIDTRLTKAWTAINRLSIIWKSDLTDKMKRSFFQAAVASILLYGCTTWTLTKRLEKKLDGNYTRMLRAILNKSWRQHPARHQLYGHLPPITKTIQVRRTRHAGHCWRSRDELISDELLWTPTHGRAKAGRPARAYIQQLCEDTGCCPEDLPEAMNDREK